MSKPTLTWPLLLKYKVVWGNLQIVNKTGPVEIECTLFFITLCLNSGPKLVVIQKSNLSG